MTIKEIACTLNRCAIAECDGCKYESEKSLVDCQMYLIRDLGKELEKIIKEQKNE